MVEIAQLLTEVDDFSPESSLVLAKWEIQWCFLKVDGISAQ